MTKKPHGLTGQKNAMKGPVPRSVRMSVRVPPDLVEALDRLAARDGMTRSDMVVGILTLSCMPNMWDVSPR
jgi:hypothetical protein